jgi:hypothetical protein
MIEEIAKTAIQEFGSDFVRGMPSGQRIEMVSFTFEHITIWEEYKPIGTQHLKAEDIIEELKSIPECIRNYITSIVLSPFDSIANDFWRERTGDKDLITFANPDPHIKQITIYAISQPQSILKKCLKDNMTIQHEAGHMIDFLTPSKGKFFSEDSEWCLAMLKDEEVKQKEKAENGLPAHFISDRIEKYNSNPEDFAESIAIFSVDYYRKLFREYNPNRCEILKRILNAR